MENNTQHTPEEWEQIRAVFQQRRQDPSFHLGCGDIRLTLADQVAIAGIVEDLQRYSASEESILLRECAEALRDLYDEQNGPPLERRAQAWHNANGRAFVALTKLEAVWSK